MINDTLIKRLRECQHLAIVTGAGISAESGIPTFRDALTGLWETYDAETLASERGFRKDPALVWGWYEWRRHNVLQTKPNPAHKIIAQLEKQLPKVTLITQNVDDLHERAGSTQVVHLHGSIHQARCLECGAPYNYPQYTDKPDGFSFPEQKLEPPHCECCHGLIRPGVVWFGESLPVDVWHYAEEAAEECDLMMVIGTSSLVFPAANLPLLAIGRGTPAIQVNPTDTQLSQVATFNLKGKAGVILPRLYELAFITELGMKC